MWWLLRECENNPVIFILGILFVASVIVGLIDEGYIHTPGEIWNDFWGDRREKQIETIEPETEKVKREREDICLNVRELLEAVRAYNWCWEWSHTLPDEDKEKERKRLVVFLQYLMDWARGFTPWYLCLADLPMRDIRKKKWISHVRFWEEKRKRISFLVSELTPQVLSSKEWVMDKGNGKKEIEISFSPLLKEIGSLDEWEKMNVKGVKWNV